MDLKNCLLQHTRHVHTCTHTTTAGTKQPIEEGKVTVIEIPKGKSELGLSYCWCDDVVSMYIHGIERCMCLAIYMYMCMRIHAHVLHTNSP